MRDKIDTCATADSEDKLANPMLVPAGIDTGLLLERQGRARAGEAAVDTFEWLASKGDLVIQDTGNWLAAVISLCLNMKNWHLLFGGHTYFDATTCAELSYSHCYPKFMASSRDFTQVCPFSVRKVVNSFTPPSLSSARPTTTTRVSGPRRSRGAPSPSPSKCPSTMNLLIPPVEVCCRILYVSDVWKF